MGPEQPFKMLPDSHVPPEKVQTCSVKELPEGRGGTWTSNTGGVVRSFIHPSIHPSSRPISRTR